MREPHILIAEDDPSLQTVLAETFRSAGYRVTAAADGDETLKLFRAQAPDAVVLDVGMPGRNGFEVCREIRARPGAENLPIIFLTARGAEADRQWGLDAGADDYLTKPFDPAALTSVVAELIESHRQGDERNPLTKLPELSTITRRASELKAGGRPVAVALLEFEAEAAGTYRQKYGDVRFAAAIRIAATCLRQVVSAASAGVTTGKAGQPSLLLGHAGDVSYSRFVLAGTQAAVAAAAARAHALFHRQAPGLYDPPDRERGFVAARRADGTTLQAPLLELRFETTTLEALANESDRTGDDLDAA
jgi:DNA-binding response OmpR family regulator